MFIGQGMLHRGKWNQKWFSFNSDLDAIDGSLGPTGRTSVAHETRTPIGIDKRSISEATFLVQL